MKVLEKNYQELARLNATFTVPSFQRQYSWRTREFTQLWDDFQSVLDGTRKKHFMGTVVLKPEYKSTLSVIDGQQRLITFTIILKVLHELCTTYHPALKREIEKLIFFKSNSKITVSFYDQAAFGTLFENPSLLRSSKNEHKRVKECYEFFTDHVETFIRTSTGQEKTNFFKVFDTVTRRMAFVEIALGDEDDIHAIFETINYAGVPLTSADLARNFVLGQAKTDDEKKRLNRVYWQPLEVNLRTNIFGSSRVRNAELQKVLPEFLRAVLVVERQKYISATDLFRELRFYFKSGNIEEKLKLLSRHSVEYCKYLDPINEKNVRIRKQLQRILDLKMTTFYPALLVLFSAHTRGAMASSDLIQAMRYTESFLVRRSFNSKVSRDLGQVFARIASALSAAEPKAKLINILVQSLKAAKWPTDDEFKPCFVSTAIYTNAPAMARFALIYIEKQQPKSMDLDLGRSVQIEHIFPQGANSSDWDSEDMPDLKKRLHAMGNLTLTKVNQKLGRRGFLDKKLDKGHGYKNSSYWLTRTFMSAKQWTAKEVDVRGNKLLTAALKLWPYPI